MPCHPTAKFGLSRRLDGVRVHGHINYPVPAFNCALYEFGNLHSGSQELGMK